jgi:cytochrome c oxidase subunit IV
MSWRPPRVLLLSWLGLLALLGLTVAGAYQPFGVFNTGLALAIAAGKALIVAAIFMELRESNALTLAFAGAGFFWLAIMLCSHSRTTPRGPISRRFVSGVREGTGER